MGRLREVVRQELVAAELVEHTAGKKLEVLDVGCGQGTQALRLARAGHSVTGLDISKELLDRFRAELDGEPAEVRDRVRLVLGPGEAATELTDGPFDVLLCHGVLMYLDDITPMLTALSRLAAQRAMLSLLVRNGLALAMRNGLCGDWATAQAAFDTTDYTNRLGLPAHAHTPADLDAVLVPLGWNPERWYGVRVFTDHRDEPAPSPDRLRPILAAEQEAGRRDPYRAVAALLHVLYRRDNDRLQR
ncbi:MAG: methyltransferase domain-containing protein [Actinobacteria bacterium]|nr:methyltransferase domain-containing protein [Actinomycetota bacterium]